MSTYICIDLKSFYASVECVERGLDSMESNLVVADPTRGGGAICLAVSPHLKALGVRNRCRIFEIPKDIDYITAMPRMKKYIEYSANIYEIYLKYVSKDDIHVYSIDEAFLDVTNYLSLYKKNPKELALTIMNDIYDNYGIRATAGIGTNLYLCKVALDIIAKHAPDFIGILDEDSYKEKLWYYEPLSDFWQIGTGISNRLHRLNIHNMYELSIHDERELFKEFGINARLLIDHSKGIEPTTIKEIKEYKPKHKSISNSQILFKDYNKEDALKVLIEMLDIVYLELIRINKYTSCISFYVGYSKDIISPLSLSRKIDSTDSFQVLLKCLIDNYNRYVSNSYSIRRLGITLSSLCSGSVQLDLFNKNDNEEGIGHAINEIKDKYGKNYLFRGVSLEENATALKRNRLIGGHNAE
ncbi:MAG: DNA repair protein [Bacilli bacterium]|nr:DNA repair protein [Bacilli bacterium]